MKRRTSIVFATLVLVISALVLSTTSRPADAHYFGHYYITLSGPARAYAHTTANTYYGIDVGYVEMFMNNHAGSLSTTCAGTGAGCFTGTWTYTPGSTQILTKHCMHATDGHHIGQLDPWVSEANSYCARGNGVVAEVTHFHGWQYV